MVVRLLRRARREARLASARKEEVIEVVLSSRLGRDARTASPQGRFAPSPSLSLSLSPLERPRLSFESGRRRALRLGLPAPNGFSPCCLRVSQSRWSRSFLSRLRGGSLRSRSILSPALLCAQPDPFEFARGILLEPPTKKIFGGLRTEKKGSIHPSMTKDLGPGFGLGTRHQNVSLRRTLFLFCF